MPQPTPFLLRIALSVIAAVFVAGALLEIGCSLFGDPACFEEKWRVVSIGGVLAGIGLGLVFHWAVLRVNGKG